MNLENIDNLLNLLIDALNVNDFGEDKEKIKYFYNELQKCKKELPTMEKLNQMQEIEIDLEVKYDSLNEMSYYFDPLCAEVERKIHKKEVEKIREENRRICRVEKEVSKL